MTGLCGCDGHIPTTGDVLLVLGATVVGLVLFGLGAALHLVWRATDVSLPTEDELQLQLAVAS